MTSVAREIVCTLRKRHVRLSSHNVSWPFRDLLILLVSKSGPLGPCPYRTEKSDTCISATRGKSQLATPVAASELSHHGANERGGNPMATRIPESEALLTPAEVDDVPGRPEDGHPVGEGWQAFRDPHAGRPPPLPRVRGPGTACGDPAPAHWRLTKNFIGTAGRETGLPATGGDRSFFHCCRRHEATTLRAFGGFTAGDVRKSAAPAVGRPVNVQRWWTPSRRGSGRCTPIRSKAARAPRSTNWRSPRTGQRMTANS